MTDLKPKLEAILKTWRMPGYPLLCIGGGYDVLQFFFPANLPARETKTPTREELIANVQAFYETFRDA